MSRKTLNFENKKNTIKIGGLNVGVDFNPVHFDSIWFQGKNQHIIFCIYFLSSMLASENNTDEIND